MQTPCHNREGNSQEDVKGWGSVRRENKIGPFAATWSLESKYKNGHGNMYLFHCDFSTVGLDVQLLQVQVHI
jgi:hypothetical protein